MSAPAGPAPRPRPSGRDPCPVGPIARILALASEAPDRPALRQIGGNIQGESGERGPDGVETVVTRGDLVTDVSRTAGALRAIGVGEGHAVALLLPNSMELVFLHLALWSIGATAVVLSPAATASEIARCLQDARPIGLIAHSRARKELAAAGVALPRLRFEARVDELGRPGAAPWLYSFGGGAEPELREPAPDLAATIHFTYKGLGYPLGAVHTYEHYARGAHAMACFFRPGPDHTFLAALPLSHVYGINGSVLVPLYAGSACAIVRTAKPQQILRFALTHRANVLCLVPPIYRLLAMCARRAAGLDLSETHWVTGGSHLTAELYRELEEDLGVRPMQGYGLTEALIVTASNAEWNRPGALGVPLFSDTEIVALDEAGRELPRGETGEIAIRAPTVMTRYVNRPDETAQFLREGRLLTGDRGRVDEDGFLHFAGRTRRFAKVAGFMVDLEEVESAVCSHPAVETCAVLAEPDEIADEIIRAAVTLRPGAEVALAELVEHCAARLAFYKVPKAFRFVKSGGAGRG